jgi:hypothetical protein
MPLSAILIDWIDDGSLIQLSTIFQVYKVISLISGGSYNT